MQRSTFYIDKQHDRVDEVEALKLEEQTLQRELQHLLAQEVPTQWRQIIYELNKCCYLLGGGYFKTQDEDRNQQMWAFHQQQLNAQRAESEKREQELKKQQKKEQRRRQVEELRRKKSYDDLDGLDQDDSDDEDEENISETATSTSSSTIIPTIDITSPFQSKPQEQVLFSIDKVARGFINIEGYRIISGKVNMRVQKHKRVIETRIEKNDPYLLHQVQRAHHFAENAIDKLNKITNTLGENNSHNSVDTLIRALEDVMAIIQRSREQIGVDCGSTPLSGSSSTITASLSSTYNVPLNNIVLKLQQGFYPPLPTDVVLEYTVEETRIKVSVYTLSFASSKTLSDNPKGLRTFILPSKPGEVCCISEKFSTVCKVAFLSEALKDMTEAFKRCVRLRDKLQLHRQYL
ncbi:hypothetical protein AKO1_003394 [Acrasis kona]|uniref:Mediator complex subunit 17 n=1 Tax=Acrasis kona TaxID=1008807 RepID=A0AAW2ZP80_9EUKA